MRALRSLSVACIILPISGVLSDCVGPIPGYPQCSSHIDWAAQNGNYKTLPHWADFGGDGSRCSIQMWNYLNDPTTENGCPNPYVTGDNIVVPNPEPIVINQTSAYFLGLGDWGAEPASKAPQHQCQGTAACGSMHYHGGSSIINDNCEDSTCTNPAGTDQGWCCDERAQSMVATQLIKKARELKPGFLLAECGRQLLLWWSFRCL